MRAELKHAPIADVHVSHGGETVVFDLSYFENSKGGTFGLEGDELGLDPFSEINVYWSQLKEVDQLAIFNTYREIREVMDSDYEIKSLQEKLFLLLGKLMSYHSFEAMELFMRYNVVFSIPSDIEAVFDLVANNIIGTRERTYIREDYRQLIILSIALRPLGILWGEYINRVERVVGNVWKESNAFNLLIATWVLDSEPLKRLETYVKANVDAMVAEQGSASLTSAIIAGIGSEDYPRWLLALTIMKRVVFADINNREDRSNIIQSIYGFIQNKLNNSAASFKGRVNNKNLETDAGGDGSKLSIFESYKAKIDVPIGEVAVAEFVFENPVLLAQQIEPTLTPETILKAIEAARPLMSQRIMNGQLHLAQWIFSSVIPMRIIPYLEKSYVVTALAITSAVLYQRGFPSLAALASAYPIASEEGILQIGSDPVRIPKETLEKLDDYYPYARRATNKIPRKKPNPAQTAINNIYRRFSKNDWYVTLPEEWLKDVYGIEQNRTYSIQPDLKLRLTELIININERLK